MDKIKLIVTDIDGTLVMPGSNTPSNRVRDIFKYYIDHGTKIALASGRPLAALKNLFEDFSDNLIYICANGTKIVIGGETVSVSPLANKKELASIMEIVRSLKCDFMVDTINCTMVENTVSEEFYYLLKKSDIEVTRVNDVGDYWNQVLKISLDSSPAGPFEFIKNPLLKEIGGNYTLIPTGGRFVDIIGKNVNKGTAVRTLQRLYDIKSNETIVFGDAMNDVDMFDTSLNSYAVNTAVTSVLKRAKSTILPPNEDGVARCLARFI